MIHQQARTPEKIRMQVILLCLNLIKLFSVLVYIKRRVTRKSRAVILTHSRETPPGVLHQALGFPLQERHWTVKAAPEVGHEDGQRDGTPLL